MDNSVMFSQRIGKLISKIRIQRGLTQSQLAKITNTSQSAINRIEKGHQNLSLATIETLSQGLQHPLVSLNDDRLNFAISGGRRLAGEIELSSSPQSCLSLIGASLINQGRTRIENVTKTRQVLDLISLLKKIGVDCKWQQSALEIRRPRKINLDSLSKNNDAKSLKLIVPLLAEFSNLKVDKANLGISDQINLRDNQAYFKKVGVSIKDESNSYRIKNSPNRQESTIVFLKKNQDLVISLIIAAGLKPAKTTFEAVDLDPEIYDVCLFLKSLGAKIDGIGSSNLTVEGKDRPFNKSITIKPSGDPIEALFFLVVGIATRSTIKIENFPLEFLKVELDQLEAIGQMLEIEPQAQSRGRATVVRSPKLSPLPSEINFRRRYLPFLIIVAALGDNPVHLNLDLKSATDSLLLTKIGISVQEGGSSQIISSPNGLVSGDLDCLSVGSNLSLILIIAGLATGGLSHLRNVAGFNRDYSGLVEKLNLLGADIEVLVDI